MELSPERSHAVMQRSGRWNFSPLEFDNTHNTIFSGGDVKIAGVVLRRNTKWA